MPAYGQKHFKQSEWKNKLLALASGQGKKGAAGISADATVYRCHLEAGKKLVFKTGKGRKIFVYVTAGGLWIGKKLLEKNCQARIENEETLAFAAKQAADFVLADLPD